MNNKEIIAALSQDLYRVAIGLHRGSDKMAAIFINESLKRREMVDIQLVKPYIKTYLYNLPEILRSVQSDKNKTAEDALMLSTIFRNYSQRF